MRLKSIRNDYLAAKNDGKIVSTSRKSLKNVLWEVHEVPDTFNEIKLKNVATGLWLTKKQGSNDVFASSFKGSFSVWEIRGRLENNQKILLKSSKGEYLHRCGNIWCDVTTWHSGQGNAWTIEL